MMMSRGQRVGMTVLTIAVFFSLLWVSLHHDPHRLKSALIGKTVPVFQADDIAGKPLNQTLFYGKITVLNVFASWCDTCAVEHVFWINRSMPSDVQLVALDYMDSPEKAAEFLKDHGNPYDVVISDPKGKLGIDFGVYGVPETYLIDQAGVIRFKRVGVVTSNQWKQVWLPRIRSLEVSHAST